VKECRDILKEKLHISFVASISNIHEDMSEIAAAYTEVKDAVEYRKLIGSSGITRYEDIDNPRYSYDYSIETEEKLINYIKTGDFDKSGNVFEEVLKSNLYDSSFSGEMAKCLMFDITSTIVKTMYEICDITVIEDIQPIKRLLKCSTIVEMKLHITIILKEVCKYVKENGKNSCQLSSAVLEYIKSNYYDNNLNVSTMSSEYREVISMKKALLKTVCFAIAIFMLFAMLTACTGKGSTVTTASSAASQEQTSTVADTTAANGPIYPLKADVKLTYWNELNPNASDNYANMGDTPFAQELSKRTGIQVEYMHSTTDEAFALLMASNYLPDIIEFW